MSVLLVEKDGHVATVTLNRPEARNALNPELVCRLAECWDALKADVAVRVVVLTGAPGSTFCAGFDLATSIPLMTGTRGPQDDWEKAFAADPGLAAKATLRAFDLGKPLIVAANGHAIAGGMEILLSADLRIVAEKALLGLSEVKLGLIPAMGGTALLARRVPPALATELLLTGSNISAARAAEAGFVNRVVAADGVLPAAMELAQAIAANAPLAVSAARDVIRRSGDLPAAAALALEADYLTRLAATEDAREGPRAFMEKRQPVFRGK
ncbi:MAG: enoyl-CoA hydratase/isomerase family protein [Minwuia sp.]|uniref:enoyl-CoA hydratase/isomerase family protein n=1 Tax=Minwuia sp. TaxID=2493630 RepID=UPI003A88A5C4